MYCTCTGCRWYRYQYGEEEKDMAWLFVCIGIALVLGLLTYLFMGAAMEGIGDSPGFWKGLKEGWQFLLATTLFWFLVPTGIYWLYRVIAHVVGG